jgi:hypothetical protein
MRSHSLPVGLAAFISLVLSTASVPSSRSSAAVDGVPGTLTLRVRDEHDRAIVARARVVPATRAARARLGRADLRVVTRESPVTLRLPEGRYQLIVSRGIEWSIAEQTLTIESGSEERRDVVLSHEASLSGWQGADLHVHTPHSDDTHERGGVRASDLRAEGVELAAVTDHNHVGGLDEGIDSVAGAEITTWAPEVGHFNAFPLERLPAHRGTTPERLVAELRRDPRVFVQVNHPRTLEDHISYFQLGAFDGERFAKRGFHLRFDGIEVWNGYDLARPRAVRSLLGEWRKWVARGRRLTATGGSDSHGPAGHLPGYPRTYVRARRAAELAPALKAGHAFVTSGPLLALRVAGEEPGDTVQVPPSGRVLVELSVLSPGWMSVEQAELWAGERCIASLDIPAPPAGQPLRFRMRRWLDVGHARVLHAVARGGGGLERLIDRRGVEPMAFTNAVHLVRAPQEQLAH